MADAISAVAPLVAAVSGSSSSTAPNGELTEFERLPPNDDDGADGTGLFSWLSSLVRSGSANLPPAELTTASSTANISRPRVITVSSASATPSTTTSGTTATASMHYQAGTSSSMMTTTTSTSAAAYSSSSSSSSSSSASVSIQETPAATTTSLFASFFSSPTPPPPQPQPQPAAASTPSRTARLPSMAVVPNTPSVASPSSSNQLQPQSEYATSPSPHRQTQQDTTSSSSSPSPSPKNLKPFTSVPNLRDQLQQLHSSSSSSASSSAQSPSPVSSPSTPVNPYESMPASGGAGTPQHREAVTESAAPVRPAGVMRTRSQVAQNSPLRGKPRAIPREVSLAIAPRSERVSE